MQLLLRLSAVALGIAALVWLVGYGMTSAPGRSPAAPAPLDGAELERVERLREDVEVLAKEIGERRTRNMANLRRASQHLWDGLRRARLTPREESVQVDGGALSVVVAELPGGARADEVVLVAAHYDSQAQSPGADDDASGCAVALALARELAAGGERPRTVRFAFFPNGSDPWAGTARAGSRRWAEEHEEGLVAALVLDGLGAFASTPGSQRRPPPLSWFHRDRADYLGFQADLASRALLRRVVGTFRATGRLPAEALLVPSWVPGTIASDHEALARAGVPVVLVTDTLGWRSDHAGTGFDTPDRLDYESMARATSGLLAVLDALAR